MSLFSDINNLEFIGDCEFDEAEGSGILAEDFWGMDELTRVFEGRSDLLGRFMAGLRKKYFDYEFPQLGITNRSAKSDNGITTVEVKYKGLLDNDLPDPVVEGGWVEDTASIGLVLGYGKMAARGWIDLNLGNKGSDLARNLAQSPYILDAVDKSLEELSDEESAEIEITYNAPTTSFYYVTRKEPKGPKYGQTILLSEGDFEITDIRPAIFRGRPIINREIRTVAWNKRRAGNYWECSETSQGKLVSTKVAMRGTAGKFKISGRRPKTLNFT